MLAVALRMLSAELEARVGSMRGRLFLGLFYPASSDDLACAAMRDEDDATALGLGTTVIPGGAYLQTKRSGERPGVHAAIGPTFKELERHETPDPERPSVEFHRRTTSSS